METNFKNPWLKCRNCPNRYMIEVTIGVNKYNKRKYCSMKCAIAAHAKRANLRVKTALSSRKRLAPEGFSEAVRKRNPGLFLEPEKANPMEGRFKSGQYEINGKQMFFRSGWEANYALYLDFLKEQKLIRSWEFEPEEFEFEGIRHGTTRYIPDFKVINSDGSVEYFEVKGFMDSRSRTKLKRMARYYPRTKLTLVDADDYKDIARKFGKLLKFY